MKQGSAALVVAALAMGLMAHGEVTTTNDPAPTPRRIPDPESDRIAAQFREERARRKAEAYAKRNRT